MLARLMPLKRLLASFSVSLIAFGFGLVAFAALAQTGPADAPPAAADTLDALLQQAIKVFSDWKTGGILVGLLALIHLLTNLSKLSFFADKIPANARPWIAVVLSTALAIIGAKASGASWLAAISAGIVAGITGGLATIGAHELVLTGSAAKQAERSTGAAIADAVKAGDGVAAAKVADLNDSLAAIAKITDEKARLAALADWAKSNPPAAAA